jgi:hypothetical protein
MLLAHSPHLLLVAHEHGRQLQAAAQNDRLLGPSRKRRLLADVLRRTADRLDPKPLGRPGLT